MRLENQVVPTTGSTTGIGAAMARRFDAEGAYVILHSRDTARGQTLRAALSIHCAAFVMGDLAGEHHHAQLAGAALECFGKIDTLLNNIDLAAPSVRLLMLEDSEETALY